MGWVEAFSSAPGGHVSCWLPGQLAEGVRHQAEVGDRGGGTHEHPWAWEHPLTPTQNTHLLEAQKEKYFISLQFLFPTFATNVYQISC